MIEIVRELEELRPRICVIGVGGAGGNAVANMMRSDLKGVTFIAANTDAQALQASPASHILQLGRKTTEGLGAGSRADLGRAAAQESLADIEKVLEGAHMCFIAAGLGGGTGTGAAPVIAKAARDKGILTVGVVSMPFAFEGKRRADAALAGLEALESEVDTLIVIPNQNLFRITNASTTFKDAFDLADDVLQQGVRGITDLMVVPGLINLDFADVRTIMTNRGKAMMATGEAVGDDRAIRAAEQAIANPLLDEALKGARGLIISIVGGDDLRLMEVDQVACLVKELADPDADIIWGSAFDAALAGSIRVTVVATGIDPAVEPEIVLAADAHALPLPVAAKLAIASAPLFGPPPPPLFAPAPAVSAKAAEPAPLAYYPVADAPTDDELLLTVERMLVLTPPAGADEASTIEPFEAATAGGLPMRGPSLFERMAMLARGRSGHPGESEQFPPIPQRLRSGDRFEEQIARAA